MCLGSWQAKLGWRKPVDIEQIRWGDSSAPDANALVEVQSIKSSTSLWDVAIGREYEAVISSPRIDGSLTEAGELKLQQVAQV